jgi:hypothetical protein
MSFSRVQHNKYLTASKDHTALSPDVQLFASQWGRALVAHHARDLWPSVLAEPCLLPTIEAPILTVDSSLRRALPMAAVCIAA